MVDIQQLTPRDVARKMDYAVLNRAGGENEILDACAKVRKYRFAAFHVLPCWVPTLVRELGAFAREHAVELGAPVAFPYGTASSEAKRREAETLIEAGATALDMVANVGWLLDGRHDRYERECRDHMGICREAGINAKVIIEVGYLDERQVATAAGIVAACGADFVKTATGTGPVGRPNLRDVLVIQRVLAESGGPGVRTGVKVSGIAEPRIINAYAFIRMGADRIGTRAAPRIVDALPEVQRTLFTGM